MESDQEWSVDEWLSKAGMSKYASGFVDNGYDTQELCANLKKEDLDAIGVKNKIHREILFTQAEMLLAAVAGKKAELSSSGEAPMYTEPWNLAAGGSGGSRAQGRGKQNGALPAVHIPEKLSTDGASVSRKISREKKKPASLAKPSSKQKAIKRSPISPTLHPYQREDGSTGLTKLQLKLKLREELQKDRIILSEPPYCSEDGEINENLLADLAEKYAGRFQAESLDVYDALKDIWRQSTNKSSFVTPIKKLGKDETDSFMKLQHGSGLAPPDTNYDEPFDTQQGFTIKPVSHKISLEGLALPPVPPPNKSRTMPATCSQDSNYEEPYDSVLSKEKLPKPKQKNQPPSKQISPVGSPERHKKPKHSHSLDDAAGQKSPKASPRSSPKAPHSGFRFFGRRKNDKKIKSRSQSVKDVDYATKTSGKDGAPVKPPRRAKDDSAFQPSHSKWRPHRTSIPIVLENGSSPLTTHRAGSSEGDTTGTSESEESPHAPKKNINSRIVPNRQKSAPAIQHRDSSSDQSDSERQLVKVRTTSDAEVESDRKKALRTSQSHEELRELDDRFLDIPERKKAHKQKNFISRLFKWKSSTPTSRKRSKAHGDRISSISETNALTSSISMPDIAFAMVSAQKRWTVDDQLVPPVDVGYAEVFDAIKPGKFTNPPKPPRVRVGKSPLASPETSPLVHRRIIMPSGSDSSTTDHLLQSGSAPGEISYIQSETVRSSNRRKPLQTPEPEEIKFSDSDDQRSERTSSFGSRTEESDIKIESQRPTSRTSRHSSSGSSISTEQGSLTRKPKPPPKPKPLSKKPSPPAAMESTTAKAPPKPARSRQRTLKLEGRQMDSNVDWRRKSPLEKSGSEGNILDKCLDSEGLGDTGSLPATPDRKPRPLPKPRHLSKQPVPSPSSRMSVGSQLLESLLSDKLSEENIDLTQSPYSTVWGEAGIPYALVFRYADELEQSEEKVMEVLDHIRGKELQKLAREYEPTPKASWQKHSSLDKTSVDSLLTSVGLPMYSQVLRGKGYTSVQKLLKITKFELHNVNMKQNHIDILLKFIHEVN